MRTCLLSILAACSVFAADGFAPDSPAAYEAGQRKGSLFTMDLKASIPATRKGEAAGELKLTVDHKGQMTLKGLEKMGIAYSGPYELTITSDTKGKEGKTKQYVDYTLRTVRPVKPGTTSTDLTLGFRFTVGADRKQTTANGTGSMTKGDVSVILNVEGKIEPAGIADKAVAPAK